MEIRVGDVFQSNVFTCRVTVEQVTHRAVRYRVDWLSGRTESRRSRLDGFQERVRLGFLTRVTGGSVRDAMRAMATALDMFRRGYVQLADSMGRGPRHLVNPERPEVRWAGRLRAAMVRQKLAALREARERAQLHWAPEDQ